MTIRYPELSTTLTYPYQILSKGVPSPPPWPAHISSSNPASSAYSLDWKEDPTIQTHRAVLNKLQQVLRQTHKRKIAWPIESCAVSSLAPKDYLMTLLCPVADIFNQLHSPGILNTPMECIQIDFENEFICGATFSAEDFEKYPKINPPMVICLPDNLFDANGNISPRVEYALSKALEHASYTHELIVSNFREIAVFQTPTSRRPEPAFVRVHTSAPALALRAITTAYLLRELPDYVYINCADSDVYNAPVDFIGPPQDPHAALLPDEEVFATHQRHSDFDLITLVHDRPRALQFFRWQAHMRERNAGAVVHPNDVLTVVTNGSPIVRSDIRPIYPYDPSELPADTLAHVDVIQRESPLISAGLDHSLGRSKTFTLNIERVVSMGSQRGICTIYRCHLTTIDDTPVSSSPPLCLKLYDDRAQNLRLPDECDPPFPDEYLPHLFEQLAIAEEYALNETSAYEKLLDVQGSIVPWFYGVHQFTLPDGMTLYGVLMEFIHGGDLRTAWAKELNLERQIQLIQSCRHATRVLDVSDINQRDWHAGQILLHSDPNTRLTHAVLVDFAASTQTWTPDKPNYLNNYFDVFGVLLDWAHGAGFDPDVVWDYFGEPDDWDPIVGFVRRDGKNMRVAARTMFPYIPSSVFPPL